MKDISDADAVPGWYFIRPSSINASGQVVGDAGDPPNRPFITGENGVGIRDVGASDSGVALSYASAINDAGQVGGSHRTSEFMFISRPYITGPDGMGMRYLGTPEESDSFAASVNDSGQVVGWFTTAEAAYPFITGENGIGITDLNSLVDLPDGVILTGAVDINNNGQVIATGIPEPETYALMLAGLAFIGFVARQERGQCRGL
jgi:uncharacterized membrane protein